MNIYLLSSAFLSVVTWWLSQLTCKGWRVVWMDGASYLSIDGIWDGFSVAGLSPSGPAGNGCFSRPQTTLFRWCFRTKTVLC